MAAPETEGGDSNRSFQILPSAARTVEIYSDAFVNEGWRGMRVEVDVTARTGPQVLSLAIQNKEEDGTWVNYAAYIEMVAASTGKFTWLLSPDGLQYEPSNTEQKCLPLPDVLRVYFKPVNAGSFTYSARGHYLK